MDQLISTGSRTWSQQQKNQKWPKVGLSSWNMSMICESLVLSVFLGFPSAISKVDSAICNPTVPTNMIAGMFYCTGNPENYMQNGISRESMNIVDADSSHLDEGQLMRCILQALDAQIASDFKSKPLALRNRSDSNH